jgi:Transmembrane secretion effector
VFRLLARNRDFRALYVGQIISFGGDWFALVALLGVVSDLTHGSALAISGIFMAQMVPSFVLSPFAGPVADRFDRRLVMLICSLAAAVAALGFLWIGPGRLWIAYAAQITISSLAAFFAPATGAALANLVDADDLQTAIRATNSLWGIMLAVGAAVGALFTRQFGRPASFAANAVSFAAAAAVLGTIRRPTRAADTVTRSRVRPIRDSVDAVSYAKNDPVLFALLFAKGGVGLAGGVVALLTNLAIGRYHGGDGSVGVLMAARGVGVVVGPWLAKRFTRGGVFAVVRACAYASMVYGVAYLGVAFAPVLALAAVGTAVAHLGGGSQWALSSYALQARAADIYRGRVLAADMALVMLASTLSYLVAAGLKELVGAGAAMGTLALISFLWGVVYLRLTRALGHSDGVTSVASST